MNKIPYAGARRVFEWDRPDRQDGPYGLNIIDV